MSWPSNLIYHFARRTAVVNRFCAAWHGFTSGSSKKDVLGYVLRLRGNKKARIGVSDPGGSFSGLTLFVEQCVYIVVFPSPHRLQKFRIFRVKANLNCDSLFGFWWATPSGKAETAACFWFTCSSFHTLRLL